VALGDPRISIMLQSGRLLVQTIFVYSREVTPCGVTTASISVTAEESTFTHNYGNLVTTFTSSK
jgi:hypothetical protein